MVVSLWIIVSLKCSYICAHLVTVTKLLLTVHVSDIHCSYDNVQKLKDKIKQDQIKLDVVLISGDIANVPLDQYYTASKELLQEHHDILLRIVTEFVPVAEKVYFIPGNVRSDGNSL